MSLWVFCFPRSVKFKALKLTPVLISGGVIGLFCLIQVLVSEFGLFPLLQRTEWMTYDWRVREAAKHSPAIATNLGFVAITDDSIESLLDGSLPYQFGLYWPRQVYGRLVNELAAQGARAVAFDIVFGELRPDHAPVRLPRGGVIASDEFFVGEMRGAGNVILASDKGLLTHDFFRTNAWAGADISAQRDPDGILRRVRAFTDINIWHPLIRQAATLKGWDLREAQLRRGQMIFPVSGGQSRIVLLDQQGNFDAASLYKELTGEKPPPGAPEAGRAFTRIRTWQTGIVLAARELGLDLGKAAEDLEHGRIVFTGPNGTRRILPVDHQGRFYVDWSLTPFDPRLTKESIESLLTQYENRRNGDLANVTNRWRDKLVLVGSTATGNDLTDLGATPLEKETYLLSQHWNVANSLLTQRYVRPASLPVELLIIVVLGALTGTVTWKFRAISGSLSVLALGAVYLFAALWLYIQWRIWLPLVLPWIGALFVNHLGLVVYRVRVEQTARRKIKDVFSRIVSPNVVNELLEADKLALGGARRRVTVFFADVRGFTEMTEDHQARALEHVARHKLTGAAAENYFEEQAQEILRTVNLYLGLIADRVKQHEGTLDKYIGDCVMAFWGAPTPNDQHALRCVQAVIDAQRAILELNQQRTAENRRREEENVARALQGREPLPLLTLLTLGSGINTGVVTVGLMGSAAHLVNYTVFGREVNLASRLEGVSGRGRIIISEATYQELLRDAPALASTCLEQPLVMVKGFREPVRSYEVPWKPSGAAPAEAGEGATAIFRKEARA